MSKRPSLIPRTEPAALAPAAPMPAAPMSAGAQKAATRQGQRAVTTYVSPLAFKQLKALAVDQEQKMQDVQREALNLLFEKHGLSRLA